MKITPHEFVTSSYPDSPRETQNRALHCESHRFHAGGAAADPVHPERAAGEARGRLHPRSVLRHHDPDALPHPGGHLRHLQQGTRALCFISRGLSFSCTPLAEHRQERKPPCPCKFGMGPPSICAKIFVFQRAMFVEQTSVGCQVRFCAGLDSGRVREYNHPRGSWFQLF